MKKQDTAEKEVKLGYGTFAFIGALFTLVIVLFLGAILILK